MLVEPANGKVRNPRTRLRQIPVHARGRQHRGHQYVYELLYDGSGKDGGRFVMGAVDAKSAAANGTPKGAGGNFASVGLGLGPHWGGFGGRVVGGGDDQNTASIRDELTARPMNAEKSTVGEKAANAHHNGITLPTS